jgi:hypothetical protein
MCNKFIDRGPDLSVRGARHFSPNNVKFSIHQFLYNNFYQNYK